MYIKKKVIDQVGVLTIDRQDALNAVSLDILKELDQAIKTCISDQNIGVIILTGAGDKAFIAGADVKVMQELDVKRAAKFAKVGQKVTMTIENSPKPVIAAINGFALGGGCEIAIACHVRYASDSAVFAQPEVKLGLIPGWGGTQRLPRIVGKGVATELVIGGHMINAKEALRIGLVNKVFSPDRLMDETILFCKLVLKNGPISLGESLRCINESAENSLIDGLSIELESFSNLFTNDETKEGLSAFVEKRHPRFRT